MCQSCCHFAYWGPLALVHPAGQSMAMTLPNDPLVGHSATKLPFSPGGLQYAGATPADQPTATPLTNDPLGGISEKVNTSDRINAVRIDRFLGDEAARPDNPALRITRSVIDHVD